MDLDEAAPAPRRRFRLPWAIGIGLTIAVAAWTAIWSTARSRILDEVDHRLGVLAERGIRIACADRSIGGYPFRMELACNAPGVTLAETGVSGSAGGLRVVAQVWDPRLILVEFDGPGVFGEPNRETSAKWRTLRASLRWSATGVDRVSIAAEGLDLTTRPTGGAAVHLTASHAEVHGRPSGEGRDLDLAASLAAASLTLADKRVGPPAAAVSVSARLVEFLPPGPGPALPAFAARGGRIDPVKLGFSVGGIAVEGSGATRLDEAGRLDGMITLVARGLESLASGGAKDLGPELTAVLSGFVLLGKASHDPALPGRRLEMIVDHGLVRIGRLTLGQMAPLFGAAR